MTAFARIVEKSAYGCLEQLAKIEGKDYSVAKAISNLYEHSLAIKADNVVLDFVNEMKRSANPLSARSRRNGVNLVVK